jgi:hypothetical protein
MVVMLGAFAVTVTPNVLAQQFWKNLINNNSSIIVAAASCQYSNGLVELHWKIMVHMARAYLTKKQMPWSFWLYLVAHSGSMMNDFLGKFGGKLASHFLLTHGEGHDKG